jgi:methylase of polypeptide subunit release factors
MFSADFFPTPQNVIEQILTGEDLTGKTVLEPSAGKGNIVDFCAGSGAFVIACENNRLKKDTANKMQSYCRGFFNRYE